MHARQQIRNTVAGLLAGLVGGNVFVSRMRPADALPCLLVTTDSEDVQPGSIGNLLERELRIVIRVFAKGNASLDDMLDTVAAEVEAALAAGLPGAVLDKVEIDFDDELERPVGSLMLAYRYTYFTAAGSPGTLI